VLVAGAAGAAFGAGSEARYGVFYFHVMA